MSAHWSKWSKGTRQTWWKDSEEEKVAFWWNIYLYKGGSKRQSVYAWWGLKGESTERLLGLPQGENMKLDHLATGAARCRRLLLGRRGRQQWRGVQESRQAFGMGWKGESWRLLRLGRRWSLQLRCRAPAVRLGHGWRAQVFEIQVYTGVAYRAGTVKGGWSMFCSILSTLRLPRSLVVLYIFYCTYCTYKLYLVWSAYHDFFFPSVFYMYLLKSPLSLLLLYLFFKPPLLSVFCSVSILVSPFLPLMFSALH